MASLFCCGSIQPYRPQYLLHQSLFNQFMHWAAYPKGAAPETNKVDLVELKTPFAIQLVRQVNYGPLESKRYFIPAESEERGFLEITEEELIQANFKKLNSYKNFRCEGHNKFFKINVYQKNPTQQHHWRVNISRPAGSIDL